MRDRTPGLRCLAVAVVVLGLLGSGSAVQAENYGTLEAYGICDNTPAPVANGGMYLVPNGPLESLVYWELAFDIGAGRRATDARVYREGAGGCTTGGELTILGVGAGGSGSGSYTLDVADAGTMFYTHIVKLSTDDGAGGSSEVYWYTVRDPKDPPPWPVPTVSEWGLVGLTMLLLTVGTIMLRRRGAATA